MELNSDDKKLESQKEKLIFDYTNHTEEPSNKEK